VQLVEFGPNLKKKVAIIRDLKEMTQKPVKFSRQ